MILSGRQLAIDRARKEFIIETEPVSFVKPGDWFLARVRILNVERDKVWIDGSCVLTDLVALEPVGVLENRVFELKGGLSARLHDANLEIERLQNLIKDLKVVIDQTVLKITSLGGE